MATSTASLDWQVSGIPISWTQQRLIGALSESLACLAPTVSLINIAPKNIAEGIVQQAAIVRFAVLPQALDGKKASTVDVGEFDPLTQLQTIVTLVLVSHKSDLRLVWRVQGILGMWSREDVTHALSYYFQCAPDQIEVITCAPDINARERQQVATVRFKIPLVGVNSSGDDLSAMIHTSDAATGTERMIELTLDTHFRGLTVLHSPPDDKHRVNVLALSGLGSHPFGSFVFKGNSRHMWLKDDLPSEIPNARVIIYGYDTKLKDSDSFASIKTLAQAFRTVLQNCLIDAEDRPYILLAHSLGGLLVQEAILQISESTADGECDLLRDICAIFFFGVPCNGMVIEPLLPLVNDQPNRPLIDALNSNNPAGDPNRRFSHILSDFTVCCFYETLNSPSVAWNEAAGKYDYSGPSVCLVDMTSATACLRKEIPNVNCIPIEKTHTDLVKLSRYDPTMAQIINPIKTACRMIHWMPTYDQGVRLMSGRNPDDQTAQQFFEWVQNTCRLSTDNKTKDSFGLVCAYRGMASVNKIRFRRPPYHENYLNMAWDCLEKAQNQATSHTLAYEHLKVDELLMLELMAQVDQMRGKGDGSDWDRIRRGIASLERDFKANYNELPPHHGFKLRVEGLKQRISRTF